MEKEKCGSHALYLGITVQGEKSTGCIHGGIMAGHSRQAGTSGGYALKKRGKMNKITYWLGGLAERADLGDWFPRKFWRVLMRYYDKKAGFLDSKGTAIEHSTMDGTDEFMQTKSADSN